LHKPKRVQFHTIRGSGPLPSIEVQPSFQDIAKAVDPAKIKEQLRHANEQLKIDAATLSRSGTRAATRQRQVEIKSGRTEMPLIRSMRF
jgi:hypothetical protein